MILGETLVRFHHTTLELLKAKPAILVDVYLLVPLLHLGDYVNYSKSWNHVASGHIYHYTSCPTIPSLWICRLLAMLKISLMVAVVQLHSWSKCYGRGRRLCCFFYTNRWKLEELASCFLFLFLYLYRAIYSNIAI